MKRPNLFLLILAAVLIPMMAKAQTHPVVQREHISIRDEGGRGSTVILIPGLSSPRAVWDGVVPGLKAKHHVLTVQVNGFGGDDPRDNLKPGILDGIVAELDSHIRDRKIASPAVVGHSMGGLVAMMLAVRHPDSAGRVMVVDALPFIGTIFQGGATVAAVTPNAVRMRDMIAATPPAKSPVTADPGGIWSNTPAGRIQVAEWGRRADPRVVAQAMYEDLTTDLRPDIAKITARPFTVLYATGAGPQAKAIWERDYAGSPATLVPVADSLHFIMLDQPKIFAKALDEFLAK
ncbi:alpha/beta fold hydrolase [Sphingomonas sp. Leaf33]|uniref:alpha/beta fold hydrolase n=1 Tax=Sphingomonas sp. Leaf33 TaxID=1736215 RepID=UPI000A6C2FA9|nr:alpha/beta hydrolase [Sphingomonas sp. Leaf33]